MPQAFQSESIPAGGSRPKFGVAAGGAADPWATLALPADVLELLTRARAQDASPPSRAFAVGFAVLTGARGLRCFVEDLEAQGIDLDQAVGMLLAAWARAGAAGR